jgi:hypothetical protein
LGDALRFDSRRLEATHPDERSPVDYRRQLDFARTLVRVRHLADQAGGRQALGIDAALAMPSSQLERLGLRQNKLHDQPFRSGLDAQPRLELGILLPRFARRGKLLLDPRPVLAQIRRFVLPRDWRCFGGGFALTKSDPRVLTSVADPVHDLLDVLEGTKLRVLLAAVAFPAQPRSQRQTRSAKLAAAALGFLDRACLDGTTLDRRRRQRRRRFGCGSGRRFLLFGRFARHRLCRLRFR